MINKKYKRKVVTVCFDPLKQEATFLLVQAGNRITTGMAYLLATNHFLKAYDLVYSKFEIELGTNSLVLDPAPTLRDAGYIVGFTKEEVDDLAKELSGYTDKLVISSYKHPDKDDYALPWIPYIVTRQIPEPPRIRYEAFVHQAELDGRLKSRTEMLADGWA